MTVELRVLGVTVRLNGFEAVKAVTLEVHGGELVSLLGPNGAGKTSLLRAIAGALKYVGAVYVDGKEISRMGFRDRAVVIDYVSPALQKPPKSRVLDFVVTGLYPRAPLRPWTTPDETVKAKDALHAVGAGHLANRELSSLSSGELQRVLIARALAKEPKVLLVDEPTAFLDVKHKVEVMELLRRMAKDKRMAVIIATHELCLAARYSDKVVLMHRGTVVAAGRPEEVITECLVERVYGVKTRIIRDPEVGLIVVPLRGGPCGE